MHVPTACIDGVSSSLAQAGVDAGVTVAPSAAYTPPRGKSVAELLGDRTQKDDRYLLEEEIARGGMGAVLRAIDCDLRREVAVKYMLDESDHKRKTRFIEEAQIAGQLEHPNIVPVHEIGVDRQNRLYFAMKMVHGRSLAQIFDDLRSRSSDAERKYPLTRLLTIFVNICNALAYAHSRNVIHRDLKPANIMIGEFGEVYVMDWGLAKLLTKRPSAGTGDTGAHYFAALEAKAAPPGAGVSISKDDTEALTQEGAILGTPAFMPPEQARGDSNAIDERSDIYALGAILYAMLTLEPPVERTGDRLELLKRVTEGQIKRPEVRTPSRTIPPELSAIAMKALARDPEQRYQTVEGLRRDIELFLAGRSVSAKQDSAREQIRKLIVRNKGVSASLAAGIGLLVLTLSVAFYVNLSARLHAETQQTKAENALASLETAQRDKEAAIRRSLAVMVRAGKQLANENRIDLAEEQVRLTLDYDPKNLDARLLKAQILVAKKQWPAAQTELEPYVRQRPRDSEAVLLLDTLANRKPGDGEALLSVVESLQRQKVPGLAAPLLADLDRLVTSKKNRLFAYQQQIEGAWKGLGQQLTLQKDGNFRLILANKNQIVDLAPLKGLPLNELYLDGNTQIKDLSPLEGMPLRRLNLGYCLRVDDISPLKGMPLEWLSVADCKGLADLTPLKGMGTLRELILRSNRVSDLSPLKGLPLRSLSLGGCQLVTDLEPLRGMPLETLDCTMYHFSPITDLTPLADLKNLKDLNLLGSNVKLAPLKGLPLEKLNIYDNAKIDSLAILRDMPLTELNWTPRLVAPQDVEMVRSLKTLKVIKVHHRTFTVADFWQRYDKGEFKN